MAAVPDPGHYDFKKDSHTRIRQIYKKQRLIWTESTGFPEVEEIKAFGGTSNLAWKQYDKDKSKKIGIMICGNSGLPGGFVNRCFYDPTNLKYTPFHPYYKTQEEDLVSNCLYAATIKEEDPEKARKDKFRQLFIHEGKFRWGLMNSSTSIKTIQRVDYTRAKESRFYGEAWVADDQPMCQKQSLLTCTDYWGEPGLCIEKKYIEDRAYTATLVFVSGPNGDAQRGPYSSTQRTYNQKAADDYAFFTDCAKAAIRAGLDAMAAKGVQVAYVGLVSAGLYKPKGPMFKPYLKNYRKMVQSILKEPVGPMSEMRGQYFDKVILPSIRWEERNVTEFLPTWGIKLDSGEFVPYEPYAQVQICKALETSSSDYPQATVFVNTASEGKAPRYEEYAVWPKGNGKRGPYQARGIKTHDVIRTETPKQALTDLQTYLPKVLLRDEEYTRFNQLVEIISGKSLNDVVGEMYKDYSTDIKLKKLKQYLTDPGQYFFRKDDLKFLRSLKEDIAVPHLNLWGTKYDNNTDPETDIDFKNNQDHNFGKYRIQMVRHLREIMAYAEMRLSSSPRRPLTLCIVKPK